MRIVGYVEDANPETGEISLVPVYGTHKLDENGAEVLDPTPIAPPVGYRRQPSLAEQIREMVRSERLALEAAAMGAETFEESEDFDVEDDYDPSTPFENDFDPPISEIREEVERVRQAQRERETGQAPVERQQSQEQGQAPAPSPKPPAADAAPPQPS
ncbi:MAG: hypothetical protein [Wigfec virus K19_160]|nr:MAG: hypothetical protein [Wigfec virus K19_160]